MNRNLYLLLILCALPVIFSQCATIFGRSQYPISLNSTPSGAAVIITNKRGDTVYNGKTPSVVRLKSSAGYFQKQDYEVRFSIAGYADKIYPIVTSINGWYFANIFIGGALGMLVIDPLSGSMWTISASQREINAILHPGNAGNNHQLQILSLNDVPAEQRKDLVRIK